jgi:hypothetical protein
MQYFPENGCANAFIYMNGNGEEVSPPMSFPAAHITSGDPPFVALCAPLPPTVCVPTQKSVRPWRAEKRSAGSRTGRTAAAENGQLLREIHTLFAAKWQRWFASAAVGVE